MFVMDFMRYLVISTVWLSMARDFRFHQLLTLQVPGKRANLAVPFRSSSGDIEIA